MTAFKTQAELLAQYPDNAKEINHAFSMIEEGCSSCKRGAVMRQLYKELGIDNIVPNIRMQKLSCPDCFKELISLAITNISLGERHRWLAIGNLAKASQMIRDTDITVAQEIIGIKIKMIQDKTFIPNLIKYLQ